MPVWAALSEFYVDTQLTAQDFDAIASKLVDSGYTLLQVKDIDKYEVRPLLFTNLLSAAGVWSGFDAEWLATNCTRIYYKRNNFFHKLKCQLIFPLTKRMTADCWDEIETRMPSGNN